jgi:hypothetical protein
MGGGEPRRSGEKTLKGLGLGIPDLDGGEEHADAEDEHPDAQREVGTHDEGFMAKGRPGPFPPRQVRQFRPGADPGEDAVREPVEEPGRGDFVAFEGQKLEEAFLASTAVGGAGHFR